MAYYIVIESSRHNFHRSYSGNTLQKAFLPNGISGSQVKLFNLYWLSSLTEKEVLPLNEDVYVYIHIYTYIIILEMGNDIIRMMNQDSLKL